jgi:hypothetical protein
MWGALLRSELRLLPPPSPRHVAPLPPPRAALTAAPLRAACRRQHLGRALRPERSPHVVGARGHVVERRRDNGSRHSLDTAQALLIGCRGETAALGVELDVGGGTPALPQGQVPLVAAASTPTPGSVAASITATASTVAATAALVLLYCPWPCGPISA